MANQRGGLREGGTERGRDVGDVFCGTCGENNLLSDLHDTPVNLQF